VRLFSFNIKHPLDHRLAILGLSGQDLEVLCYLPSRFTRVPVVETADLRDRDDVSLERWFAMPWRWRVAVRDKCGLKL
jgi:hypothetical protein